MKTEVFIAFTKKTSMRVLRESLEAWDTEDYEPVAIDVAERKYDVLRRIAAEGLAKWDYVIADLGTKPGDETGVYQCKKGQNPALKVESVAVQ